MADVDKGQGFFVKAAQSLDWGMKNRLARIFDRQSGRTVLLAVDHGYFDFGTLPLLPYADSLLVTQETLSSSIPPETDKPIVLCQAGNVHLEDAVRLNACAVAVRLQVGSQNEQHAARNEIALVARFQQSGIPVLGVTSIKKGVPWSTRCLETATRIAAETGVHFLKTYYCEPDFEKLARACPVPLVVTAAEKLAERDALRLAYKSLDQGAAGVDMGPNIFQAEDPIAFIQAVRAVVHENEHPDRAFELYASLKNTRESQTPPV